MKVNRNTITKDGEDKVENEIVSPKIDVVFKKVFGEKDILSKFLSDVLDMPAIDPDDITVANQELVPDDTKGKFCRLDLKLKVKDELVNVEIQLRSQSDYRDRALFYWAKLFTSELESGKPYGDLKKTITINILDFNLFGHEPYCCKVVPMVEETREVFSDKFGIYFFELKKVSGLIEPKALKDRKMLWMQFLNADTKEAFDMINQTEVPEIKHAVNLVYDMSKDSRIRELVRMRETAMHDEASFLADARNEGKAEGIEIGEKKGRAEEREKMIVAMRANNIPEEQIQAMLRSME